MSEMTTEIIAKIAAETAARVSESSYTDEISLIVAGLSLGVSTITVLSFLAESYNNKLAKLLSFARASLDKLKEMNDKKHKKAEFYKASRFIEHFEIYQVTEDIYFGNTFLNLFFIKKINLIKKVRHQIYLAREDFREAMKNESKNTYIDSSDVNKMQESLIKIRNEIIGSHKPKN